MKCFSDDVIFKCLPKVQSWVHYVIFSANIFQDTLHIYTIGMSILFNQMISTSLYIFKAHYT